MPAPSTLPPAEVEISRSVIQGLLASQHPDLADLPIGREHISWDNVTTRLGEGLAVRMPRIGAAAPLIEREIEWLPKVSLHWEFHAPIALRVGEPDRGYPWKWSVIPWFPGTDAMKDPLNDLGAVDLGKALRQVHCPAPEGSPHTPWRTIPLRDKEGETRPRLDRIQDHSRLFDLSWDAKAAESLWADSSALPSPEPVWVHADLHPGNVIGLDGRLSALIDWGEAGAGDPALDLGQPWMFFNPDGVRLALESYGGIDPELSIRSRGEGLANALRLVFGDYPPFMAAGWKALIGLGLADGPQPSRRRCAEVAGFL